MLPIVVDAGFAVDIDSVAHLRVAEETLATREDLVRPCAASTSLLDPVRLLIFDFDGVFTDNRVYVNGSGIETVGCSRGDGLGIERLLNHGIDAVVLSTEVNPVVAARCRKLNLEVQQGLRDKSQTLRNVVASRGLTLEHVAYVGNDVNDLECLRIAGVAVAPADADPAVRGVADLVLRKRGGYGAVREICELAIAAQKGKGEYALSECR